MTVLRNMFRLGYFHYLFGAILSSSLDNKFDISCYNKYNNGSSYRGNVSITADGIPCIKWKNSDSTYSHFTEDHNFCRNPLSKIIERPWCYIDANLVYRKCNVPVCDISCYNKYNNGSSYRGNVSITADGIPCIKWKNADSTYSHFTEDHNFCRNPLSKDIERPWCYIDANLIYGKCNVSVCAVDCDDLQLDVNVKSSENILKYNDIVTLSCKDGYIGTNTTIKCYSNSSWPTQRPICKPVDCKKLTIDAQVQSSNVLPKFNDNLTLSCKEGYLGDVVNIKCFANGSWPLQRPNCKPLPCHTPYLPRHTMNTDEKGASLTYYVGQNVHFKCEQGYNLIGKGSFKCNANRNSTVGDWNYDDQKCIGVLCPLPNVTDNLVLLSNKTEYRFGDLTTFDCVGDFELPSQLTATIECIVDEISKENGKWTGEIPICQAKAAAKHSNAMGPAIGGGIGSAVTVIVVVVVIVFIIRRRTVSQKNKNEMRYKESTLELNNINIYSQVEERVDSHIYGKTKVHHVYYNVQDTIEAEKEQDPAKINLVERYDVSSMKKRIRNRDFLSQIIKEEFSVLRICNHDSKTKTWRGKTSDTRTNTDVEQYYENTVATEKYSDKISILFETPLKHISESFWSMVDDRHVENIIFLVKENELVAEFYPKLDDIFRMKTFEIDLNSSEKPSKNILILTFNILNKARQTTRQAKMFKIRAWKDSDQYPSVETLCYLLNKTRERNDKPIMIIGSKTSGLPIGGVLSVCLNVLEAIQSDRPFNVLDNAMAVKKKSSSFFQNCEVYGLCYKVIENHLDSVNTYDIIS